MGIRQTPVIVGIAILLLTNALAALMRAQAPRQPQNAIKPAHAASAPAAPAIWSSPCTFCAAMK